MNFSAESPGAGTVALGNGYAGVVIAGNSVTVGGTTVAARNIISGNGPWRARAAPKGVNPNRSGNPNPGPNNLQNYPVLTAAVASASSITITGSLNSTANKSFTIEFFADLVPDPSGFGQGKIFLGSVRVMHISCA